MRQMLHIGEGSRLHVQNGNPGTLFGDAGPQVTQRMYLLDRTKRMGQGGNERLRDSRITLEEDYIERLHMFRLASTACTVTVAMPALAGAIRCHGR